MDKQREVFEAWADDSYYNLLIEDGNYCIPETASAWEAWQAAQKGQWTRIDYSDSDTWPEEERQYLVAWEGLSICEPQQHESTVFFEASEQCLQWISTLTGCAEEWRVDDGNMPTHYCYAPLFGGE